ncbi:E3 SUMO-protein ligase ZBED1-like [Bombina bombina]|uniref:E3 SUMO-protein ligase ZBED1-like n=1 Tax=Bombina bombina TaxID=8345 RepID=UPI00235A7AC5|nr:E3 SUMO-protein ligase ZBED1-like [Bombina bombina]
MTLVTEMLVSGRKRREDLWMHFTFDAKENKTLCKPCGVAITGKNTTNLKRHLQMSHPEIHTKIQKTSNDGPSQASAPQQNIYTALVSASKYKIDSKEQQAREDAIAKWIGRTGLPVRTIEDEDFVNMMATVDRRLSVPKKTKINNLIDKHYEDEKQKFKKRLAAARRVSICTDLWTKKGLTASFLGISACYFCVDQNKADHILLALEQVAHPHTAQSIKSCVDKCLQEWDIPKKKILTVITDNGSNMVAAFKHTTAAAEEPPSFSEEDSPITESDSESSESEIDDLRYQQIDMDRTPCVVHTLQLVVHMVQKEASVKRILDKARSVVKLFRKSSVATQKILEQCGLIVLNDCPTRWSSTFNMIARLIKVKDSVCQIANNMGWDSFLPSEWQKLTSLHDLLLPFAEHTKTLQSDTMSMSLVVPALFDLLSHLDDFKQNTSYQDLATIAQKMKGNVNQRFASFLDTTDERFSPLAAAACFVNPTVCETLVDVADENIQELLKQAEEYVIRKSALPHTQDEDLSEEDDALAVAEEENIEKSKEEAPPSTSKHRVFRFLSKCRRRPRQRTSPNSIEQQIRKYREEELLQQPITDDDTGTDFWLSKNDTFYHQLKPFALDLLAMPASQAFAERIFSVTGDLSRGRRNRARVILARSAFLKMNRNK